MKEKFIQWWNNRALPVMTKWFQEFSLFVTSVLFLKNLAAMLGVLILFLTLVFWGIRCYTNHGESRQVHDYSGLSLEEAKDRAKSRSFRIVVTDSLWKEGLEPNTVIEQTPKAFARVKQHRTIYVTISKNTPEEVELPTLVGSYDYTQYKKKLNARSVKATIRERVFDNKQEENSIQYFYYGDQKITENDLKEGVRVPKGVTLEFVVTERGGGLVETPDLVCKSYSEAEFLISSLGLTLGKITPDVTVSDQASAYVYKQVPEYNAGATMRVGEQITIYLTQDPPPGCPEPFREDDQ